MAGKDRIGALYYEVILDPRGFAKGVTSVKADADLLVRAVQNTTSELARIDAELQAVIQRSLNASGQERDILRSYAMQLMQDRKEYLQKEKDAKDAATAANIARQEAEDARIEQELGRHHRWRRKVIENSRKLEEQQLRADQKAIASARAKRHADRDYLAFYHKVAARRYKMDLEGHNTFVGHMKAVTNLTRSGFGGMKQMVKGACGGLSKLSGNFAQMLGMSPKLQGFARVFGALGPQALVIAGGVLAIGAAFTKALGLADAFAKKQMRLEAVMQGRSALARKLSDEMRALARETGMSSDSLIDFATNLKVMGVATKDIKGVAETVGALAGGDDQRMKFIAKAYTDVLTKGRLMGQEALQLANQGVPIYKALAGVMGISAQEAKDLSEAGKISAEQFKKAMEYQAQMVGGTDAMKRGTETISGQWTQIKNALNDFFLTMGQDLMPVATAFMKLLKYGVVGTVKAISVLWKTIAGTVKFIVKLLSFDFVAAMEQVIGKEEELSESLDEQLEIAMKRYEEEERVHKQQLQTAEELIKAEQQRLLTQEERTRREHQAQLNKLIMEKKITKEQALQVVAERGRVEAELKRREQREAAEKAEYEKREADLEAWTEKQKADDEKLKQLKEQAFENEEKLRNEAVELAEKQHADEIKRIDEALAKKISDRESAGSSSGASFEAGSAEEFAFLREMEMQARRDAQQAQFENEAANQRAQANAHLTAMVENTNAMANAAKQQIAQKDSLADFGYL